MCEDRSVRNLLVAQLNQSYREMFADMKGLLGDVSRTSELLSGTHAYRGLELPCRT